jgi:hypothetical protein
MGEDLLNTLGTSSEEIVGAWENREELLSGMGEEIRNGGAAERLGQFGRGMLQGGWEAVVETAGLAWDGAAFVYIVSTNAGDEQARDQALEDYEPASKLVNAYKHSEDPGDTTLAMVEGLLQLPADFVDAMWNDPEQAGKIVGGFLVPMAGSKLLGRATRGAAATRRLAVSTARSKSTIDPCAITQCSVVDDLARVTQNARSAAPKSTAATQGALSPLGAIGKRISQKQLRHIKGRKEWVDRGQGSYLNSVDDAQAILDAAHDGTAQVLGKTRQGHVVVQWDDVVGFNNNPSAGYVDQATNVFMIKGSTKPSVVPTNPHWTPPP